MRHPRVQFTVQRMMVVVAVVAGGLWGSDLWWRWRAYRHLAWVYEVRESKREFEIEMVLEKYPFDKEWIAEVRQAIEYLARMKRKYQHAASRPWIAVSLDPPEPEWLWRSEGPH